MWSVYREGGKEATFSDKDSVPGTFDMAGRYAGGKPVKNRPSEVSWSWCSDDLRTGEQTDGFYMKTDICIK